MKHQCPACRLEFTGRSDAIFCGSTCKSRYRLAQRNSGAAGATKIDDDVQVANHPLVVAVKAELAAAGRLESVEGAAAISLACAMCTPRVGSAAFVAASKELSRTMKAALKGAPLKNVGAKLAVVRPADELTTRRTKRRKAGYRSHSE
jgi:hypothetical protein